MKFYLANHLKDYIGTRDFTPVSMDINVGDRFELVSYTRYSDPGKPRGLVETGRRVYTVNYVKPGYFSMSSPAGGNLPYESINVYESENGTSYNGMWLGTIYWRMKRL